MENKGKEAAQVPAAVMADNPLKNKGMATAGITVGASALAICLWRFNWFTFVFSLVGGILVSLIACVSKKQNNAMVIASIVCSTAALLVGLVNYPDVLDPVIGCMKIAALLLECVKQVWSEWASAMQGFLYFG